MQGSRSGMEGKVPISLTPMASRVFRLKNMLSRSCIKLVEISLSGKKGLTTLHVAMGEVRVEGEEETISGTDWKKFFSNLGFDVLMDPDALLVERIKQAAVELIFLDNNKNSLVKNSDYISEKVQLPYEKITRSFSAHTSTTLEKYIILLKIEKAKELIERESFTLSEIAFMLGYSSVQYLSNQFKKTTGVTVSEFRESPSSYRIPLENLL